MLATCRACHHLRAGRLGTYHTVLPHIRKDPADVVSRVIQEIKSVCASLSADPGSIVFAVLGSQPSGIVIGTNYP